MIVLVRVQNELQSYELDHDETINNLLKRVSSVNTKLISPSLQLWLISICNHSGGSRTGVRIYIPSMEETVEDMIRREEMAFFFRNKGLVILCLTGLPKPISNIDQSTSGYDSNNTRSTEWINILRDNSTSTITNQFIGPSGFFGYLDTLSYLGNEQVIQSYNSVNGLASSFPSSSAISDAIFWDLSSKG